MSDDSLDKKHKKMSKLQQLLRLRGVRVFVVCLWLLVGFILAQIMTLLVFIAVTPDNIADAPINAVVLTTILTASTYILALIIVVGGAWRVRKWSKKKLLSITGMARRMTLKDVALALLGYVPYLAASMLLLAVIIALVPGFDAEQTQELGFSALTSPLEYILAFTALVILAPIAEEVLFRGYLFSALRGLVSFIPATLLVSGLFALVHGQWNVAIDTFVLSLVLCWLRERTGTIWAPIILHMVKNGLAFTLLFVV